jgi:hypothetical protein
VDAEDPRFVAGGRDHAPRRAAADDDRTAAQRGIVTLLDGREEGVHVGVEDGAGHMRVATCRLVAASLSLYTAPRRTG